MSGAALPKCWKCGAQTVHGARGLARCPECGEYRQTACRAFVRRIRPQGRTVTCSEPVDVETFATLPDGSRVYHGGRCRRHPDTARYVGAAVMSYEPVEAQS